MTSVIALSLRDQAERSAAAAAAAATASAAPVASPAVTVAPTPPAGYTDAGIPALRPEP